MINTGAQIGSRQLSKYLSKLRVDKEKMPDLIDAEKLKRGQIDISEVGEAYNEAREGSRDNHDD